MQRGEREPKSWHALSHARCNPVSKSRSVHALFHINSFQFYKMYQDDTSRARTWFRMEAHTCSSKYKQICNLSHWQSLKGRQVKAGVAACLQRGSGITNAWGPRKHHARQDSWHWVLVIIVTFHVTREIVIISLIHIVIFKCALVAPLVLLWLHSISWWFVCNCLSSHDWKTAYPKGNSLLSSRTLN